MWSLIDLYAVGFIGLLVDSAVPQVEDPYFHYAHLLHKFDQLV